MIPEPSAFSRDIVRVPPATSTVLGIGWYAEKRNKKKKKTKTKFFYLFLASCDGAGGSLI